MIASALPHTLDVLASVTQTTLRVLDRLGAKRRSQKHLPVHRQVGRRGEEDAYFYLRKLGYVMVARNYRSAGRRGEIDLIGWDGGILCFIEVKTRTSYDVKPAEAAVDHENAASWQAWRARTFAACRRCHGVSTWSAYTMKLRRRPHALSCSKMPSNYRKINDSAAS
jgi:Holliday junction resolvase-like predicted endonuclease